MAFFEFGTGVGGCGRGKGVGVAGATGAAALEVLLLLVTATALLEWTIACGVEERGGWWQHHNVLNVGSWWLVGGHGLGLSD